MKRCILLCVMCSIAVSCSAQNLISNYDFETTGQLRCDGWFDFCNNDLSVLCDTIMPDTTCAVWYTQDAPSSGGSWCLSAYGSGNGPPWGAETYITGQSGVNVYELKAWMKDSSYAGGIVRLRVRSQGIITNTNAYVVSNDSADWAQYTSIDTLNIQITDTILVIAEAFAAGPTAGEIRFDMIELTKIDSNLILPCIADAGGDIIDCLMDQDTMQLGGQPVVSFGLAPYTYAWETNYTGITGTVWTASYFLDDTTVANPNLLNTTFEPLMFTLYVTDSLGNTCSDQVKVRRSNYEWTLLDQSASILLGDSAMLSSQVFGGIPPLTYSWSPSTGLSDPFIANPYASPLVSTNYVLTVSDSIGCQMVEPDIWEIYVSLTTTEEQSGSSLVISVAPNPFSSYTNVLMGNTELISSLQMFNSLGQVVKSYTDVNQSQIKISRDELPSGLYHFSVRAIHGKSGWGMLLVE